VPAISLGRSLLNLVFARKLSTALQFLILKKMKCLRPSSVAVATVHELVCRSESQTQNPRHTKYQVAQQHSTYNLKIKFASQREVA
jgi:hypothetical protein